jgi:hypothetical protein
VAPAQIGWGDHDVRCTNYSDDDGTTTTCICSASDSTYEDVNCNQTKDSGEYGVTEVAPHAATHNTTDSILGLIMPWTNYHSWTYGGVTVVDFTADGSVLVNDATDVGALVVAGGNGPVTEPDAISIGTPIYWFNDDIANDSGWTQGTGPATPSPCNTNNAGDFPQGDCTGGCGVCRWYNKGSIALDMLHRNSSNESEAWDGVGPNSHDIFHLGTGLELNKQFSIEDCSSSCQADDAELANVTYTGDFTFYSTYLIDAGTDFDQPHYLFGGPRKLLDATRGGIVAPGDSTTAACSVVIESLTTQLGPNINTSSWGSQEPVAIVITRDSGLATCYINGLRIGSATATGRIVLSEPWKLSGATTCVGGDGIGCPGIADIVIWNSAATLADVQAIFAYAADRYSDTGLHEWPPFVVQDDTQAELFRVANSGNVGIGNAGPDASLEITDATAPQLRLGNSESAYCDASVATGDLTLDCTGDNVTFSDPVTLSGTLSLTGLTDDKIVYATSGGTLTTDAGLSFDGTALSTSSGETVTIGNLDSDRVVVTGSGGLLAESDTFKYNGGKVRLTAEDSFSVGVDADPGAGIEVRDATGAQQRWSQDGTDYCDLTVADTGDATFNCEGGSPTVTFPDSVTFSGGTVGLGSPCSDEEIVLSDGTDLYCDSTFTFSDDNSPAGDDNLLRAPSIQIGGHTGELAFEMIGDSDNQGRVIGHCDEFAGTNVCQLWMDNTAPNADRTPGESDCFTTIENLTDKSLVGLEIISQGSVLIGTSGGHGSMDCSVNAADRIFLEGPTEVGSATNPQTFTVFGESNIVLEGATSDSFETRVAVVDPKSDNTQTYPDDSGYIALRNFVNGTFRESFDATVTSDGATITMSLIPTAGAGDLTMRFSDGDTTLDCDPACTIVLTAGSDISPGDSFIYIPQATKVLTESTTAWPSAEHIKVAYFSVPSATFVNSDGVYANQNWNDHDVDTNSMGHIPHMAARLRSEGAKWYSGVDGNGTDGWIEIDGTPNPDTVDIKMTAGVVNQMHPHTFPAVDTSVSGTILIVNDSVTAYDNVTDLNAHLTDADGDSMSGNYYNIVIWGVANKGGEFAPVMVNLPTCSYNLEADALSDADKCSVFTMPRDFDKESSTGFLIAEVTLKHSAAGSGTWTVSGSNDLRAGVGFGGGGGSAAAQTNFADNNFTIFDESDITKVLDFQVSGITTGTTRTWTVNDSSGTPLLTAMASGDCTITTAGVVACNHDVLDNFVADEHVAHSGVDIIAGTGLTGGGTIDSSRTLNVAAGDGLGVAANTVFWDIENNISTTTSWDAGHYIAMEKTGDLDPSRKMLFSDFEGGLTLTESQISDLTHTTALTQEQVEDFAGAAWTGNTETGATVTYQDADGTVDIVVDTAPCLDGDADGTCELSIDQSDDSIDLDLDDDGVVEKRIIKDEVCQVLDMLGDNADSMWNMRGTLTPHDDPTNSGRIGIYDHISGSSAGDEFIGGFGRTTNQSAQEADPAKLNSLRAGVAPVDTSNFRMYVGSFRVDSGSANYIAMEHGYYFLCAPADDVDGDGTPGSANDLNWWAVQQDGDTDDTGDICATLTGVQCATYTAAFTEAWNTEVPCTGGTDWADLGIIFNSLSSVEYWVNGVKEATLTTNGPSTHMMASLLVVGETTDASTFTAYYDYLEVCHDW